MQGAEACSSGWLQPAPPSAPGLVATSPLFPCLLSWVPTQATVSPTQVQSTVTWFPKGSSALPG